MTAWPIRHSTVKEPYRDVRLLHLMRDLAEYTDEPPTLEDARSSYVDVTVRFHKIAARPTYDTLLVWWEGACPCHRDEHTWFSEVFETETVGEVAVLKPPSAH